MKKKKEQRLSEPISPPFETLPNINIQNIAFELYDLNYELKYFRQELYKFIKSAMRDDIEFDTIESRTHAFVIYEYMDKLAIASYNEYLKMKESKKRKRDK